MEVKTVNLDEITPDPRNTRMHDQRNIDVIKESLAKFGQYRPFVIQRAGMVIRVGNGMFQAMRDLGWTEATANILDLTDDEAACLSVLDNRSSELADWDESLLMGVLSSLPKDLFDLTGFSDDELNEIIDAAAPPAPVTEDDPPEPPEEPKTKPGQLYELGKHLLICSSCTDRDKLEHLLAGHKADLVFTDPPYGVSYVGKTKDALTIQSDDLTPGKLKTECAKWFNAVDFAIRDGAYTMATVPARPLHVIFADDWIERGWLRQIMVWNKDSMVLGHSEYHYKHEPILFGWKPGDRLENKDRTKTTVWDFARPKASREHPTMKPVEMWAYGIANHTKQNDLVFEPFGGSGTTLIACEQLGRRCFMMELDPRYCDVIVQRYCNLKGIDSAQVFETGVAP